MRRIVCVILISAFVLASASFSFADGFTTAQANDLTREFTSNSTSYIKGILSGILKAVTGSSTYSGSDSVFAKLQNIVNAVAFNNGGGLLQRFNEAFTGSYNGSSANPQRKSVLGALYAIDKALYGSHNLEGSDYQGIGWYLYDIDRKLSTSNSDLSVTGDLSMIFPWHSTTKTDAPQVGTDTYSTLPVQIFANFNRNNPDPNYKGALQIRQYTPSSLGDWYNLINTNIVEGVMRMWGRDTHFVTSRFNPDTFSVDHFGAISIADYLDVSLGDLVKSVGRLSYFMVDEDELQAKKDNKDVIEGAVQGFISPGQSASLSGSNVLEFKGSFDSIQNGFESSASASDSFSVLSSGSETYSWFSQSTADDLDSVGSGSTLRALGSDTPALDQYYQDVLFGIHFFD